MDGLRDMNGIWSGMYDYHQNDDVVKFTIWLDDQNQTLSGSMTQPNTFLPGEGDDISADIKGIRDGYDFQFGKHYRFPEAKRPAATFYTGIINDGFTEAKGTWHIPHEPDSSGNFALIRMTGGVGVTLARLRAVLADMGR